MSFQHFFWGLIEKNFWSGFDVFRPFWVQTQNRPKPCHPKRTFCDEHTLKAHRHFHRGQIRKRSAWWMTSSSYTVGWDVEMTVFRKQRWFFGRKHWNTHQILTFWVMIMWYTQYISVYIYIYMPWWSRKREASPKWRICSWDTDSLFGFCLPARYSRLWKWSM